MLDNAMQELKSRLKGTWIHHLAWARREPTPNNRNAMYDWQTVEVMFRVLHRNSNCIDVGAHGGEILKRMVEIAPYGTHHAFEPLPHLAGILRKRFPGVVVHDVAVSDKNRDSDFLFVEDAPGFSGLQRRIYDRPDRKVTTIRVHQVTLDDTIPPSERIAFIKIDIEGAEFHAIKGGIETIRRNKPVIVFEAGIQSTGEYGVKPDDLYSLMTETIGNKLSTISRWIARKHPLSREEFVTNWFLADHEYFFISYPRS